MNRRDLVARRKARLECPERHDCGLLSIRHLEPRFRGDKWIWILKTKEVELSVLFCPWCGERLE